MAAAFPIDIPRGNFYCSTNFEANYILPTQSTVFTQGLYEKIIFGNQEAIEGQDEIEPEVTESARRKRNIQNGLNRKRLYELIEKRMEM